MSENNSSNTAERLNWQTAMIGLISAVVGLIAVVVANPTLLDKILNRNPSGKLPKSCKEINNKNNQESGSYEIDPDGKNGNPPFNVYCDMTTDGGGWTVIARSTKPSSWQISNAYALGHYKYWQGDKNYTYDYREFLDNMIDGENLEIRFYDHVNPKAMDIRYSSVSKTHLLGASNEEVNFDARLSVFGLDTKIHSVGKIIRNSLFITFNSQESKGYCDYKNTKSAIVIVRGGTTQHAYSSICSTGLGAYNDSHDNYNAYRDNDPGRRVSIAVR